MNEAIEAAVLVIEALEELGVPYVIGGSLASSVHGLPRTTVDIDLVADLKPGQAETFVRALGPAFYVDGGAVQAAVGQGKSFNVIHLQSMFKVDVFVAGTNPFARQQLAHRSAAIVSDSPERRAYVISAEDTLLAKLDWYRQGGEASERQWRDILGVLAVQGARLDHTYLRDWAARLGVSDLLERALAEQSGR